MITFAVGKEIWRYKDKLSMELEGNIAKYFGGYTFECDSIPCLALPPEKRPTADQDHTEINFFFALRWLAFPLGQIFGYELRRG
jgi:hypothetical protein